MPNPTEFHFKDSFIVVLEFFFPNPRLIFHSRDWSQFYTSPSQNFVSRKIRIHTTTSSLTPPEILISRFIQTPTLHQKKKKVPHFTLTMKPRNCHSLSLAQFSTTLVLCKGWPWIFKHLFQVQHHLCITWQ